MQESVHIGGDICEFITMEYGKYCCTDIGSVSVHNYLLGFWEVCRTFKKTSFFLLTFNLVFRNILERVTKSVAYTAIIYIALTHRLTDCAPVPFGTGAFFMSYFSNRPFLRLV